MSIVTHDLAEAAGIADACAFIGAGRIVEQGSAAAVLADRASRLNQWLSGQIITERYRNVTFRCNLATVQDDSSDCSAHYRLSTM
jgi:ABC-type dipeptide/oligopeptide/nickel transport system ATPase component